MSNGKSKFKVVNSGSKLKAAIGKLPDQGFEFRALRGHEKTKSGKDEGPESIGLFLDSAAGSEYAKEKAKIVSGQFFVGTIKRSAKDPKGRLLLLTNNSARPLLELARACLLNAAVKHKVIVLRPDAVEPDTVADDDDTPSTPQPAATVTPPQRPQQPAPQRPDTKVVAQPSPEEVEFDKRLKTLLQGLAGAGPGVNVQRIKELGSDAVGQSKLRDWKAAFASLIAAEKMLQAPTPPRTATVNPTETAGYKQSQLVWKSTRDKVHSELQRLEAAILGVYEGDGELPAVTQAVRRLDGVLAKFDQQLVDKIEQINAATEPGERKRLHGEARQLVVRYQGHLDTDPLVRRLDDNPFVPVTVEAALKKSLEMLASRLA